MRKFSKEAVDVSWASRELVSSSTLSSVITTSKSVGKQETSLPTTTSSIVNDDSNSTPRDVSDTPSTTMPPSLQLKQQQQQQGILIPTFMQPLMGLDFVPLVKPMMDQTAITIGIFGESWTNKMFEELDVGCPYSTTPNSNDHEVAPPLPASTTYNLPKTLDSSTNMSFLNNNFEEEPDGAIKPVCINNHDVTQDLSQWQEDVEVVSSEPSSWVPSSIRRRNIFQQRRAQSFGDGHHNSIPLNDHIQSFSTRRKLGFRFVTKNRKGNSERTVLTNQQYRPGLPIPTKTETPQGSIDAAGWMEDRQQRLLDNPMQTVPVETMEMQNVSQDIEERVKILRQEISQLEEELANKHSDLSLELSKLKQGQFDLPKLQLTTVTESIQQQMTMNGELDPTRVDLHLASILPRQSSFASPMGTSPSMYMQDNYLRLDMNTSSLTNNDGEASFTSSTSSIKSCYLYYLEIVPSPNEFVFVDDHNLKYLLQRLDQLGYDVVTNESDRFVPTSETKITLRRYQKNQLSHDSLPIQQPWYFVHDDDILIWTGEVRHDGLGSGWPVCKSRGLVHTSPRTLMEYLMDSAKVREYNKMSQGREDLYIIQGGIDTLGSTSPYGIAGECKIVKAVNKPRLSPIPFEMISLMHFKPLETFPGSYIMVYRSVFEEDTTATVDARPVICSEMLLGAILVRPYLKDQSITEMTSVTHVYSPGVPAMIAQRAVPSSAMNMLRDLQKHFQKQHEQIVGRKHQLATVAS
jgi:hypothetical protein